MFVVIIIIIYLKIFKKHYFIYFIYLLVICLVFLFLGLFIVCLGRGGEPTSVSFVEFILVLESQGLCITPPAPVKHE